MREILTALYSHYNLDVRYHVKEDNQNTMEESEGEEPDEQHNTNEEEAEIIEPEQTAKESEKELELDAGTEEELKETSQRNELSSTLLSDIDVSIPTFQLPDISPIKSPPKQPKQPKKRKRKDYMFDPFTPIAVRKH